MQKDFDNWNILKKKIDSDEQTFHVNERQIWWCSIGLNVGSEQNGHGENFERPVLVIRKYTATTFLCLPLTTKEKQGNYYHKIYSKIDPQSWVILSQSKVIDIKRFRRFLGSIQRKEFIQITNKYKELL